MMDHMDIIDRSSAVPRLPQKLPISSTASPGGPHNDHATRRESVGKGKGTVRKGEAGKGTRASHLAEQCVVVWAEGPTPDGKRAAVRKSYCRGH